MARPGIDLAGQRFGRLLVIEKFTPNKGRAKWHCRCDCGKERVVFAHNLVGAATTSCGCRRGRGKGVVLYEGDGVTKKTFSQQAAKDLAKALKGSR